jgi:AcrR family transcriptional regulator
VSPTQGERRAATRAALVAAGRELFARDGFDATAAEAIVARAGVTRGALYHHFADKRDLFRAVHEQLEAEMVAFVGERLAGATDPFALLVAGLDAFLERCADPEFARIALDEAPAVLGWREWREVDMRYGLGLVTVALQGAMDAGVLARRPVTPLAHLLVSACGEAGLLMAAGGRRDAVRGSLLALLEGLRA